MREQCASELVEVCNGRPARRAFADVRNHVPVNVLSGEHATRDLRVARDEVRVETYVPVFNQRCTPCSRLLVLAVANHNVRSRAVMERLGMRHVGQILRPGLIAGSAVVHEAAPFALYQITRPAHDPS